MARRPESQQRDTSSDADRYSAEELLPLVNRLFLEEGPFSNSLGVTVTSLEPGNVRLRFAMRDDFVGLTRNPMLHGGVIATVLDLVGGMTVFTEAMRKLRKRPRGDPLDRLQKLNTIDLRIDYLRPGSGESFEASGYLLRSGSTVSVARMELHNENSDLVAVGTGSYIITTK